MSHDQYIGDGVYASWDGKHVVLDTRAQPVVHRICLEPVVMARLREYERVLCEQLASACGQAEQLHEDEDLDARERAAQKEP